MLSRPAANERSRHRPSLFLCILLTLSLGVMLTSAPASARASAQYDPVLAAHQLVDSTGTPVVDVPVTIVAVPVDTTSWQAGDPYPTVGAGTTDQNGYVDATLGVGLQQVLGTPAFESETDAQVTLGVDYTGASTGTVTQGLTATEDFGGYVDPVLAQQTVLANGGPLADASLVVQAEPQYMRSRPSSATYPQIATCQTDGQGHPQCSLDLSAVESSGNFNQRAC